MALKPGPVIVGTMATTQTLSARRDVQERAIRQITAMLDVVTCEENGTAGQIGHVLTNAATLRNTGTELASIHTVMTHTMLTVKYLVVEMIQTRHPASMDVVLMLES